eukprot:scaffold4112_cov60-Cylindrotheca_fusiformis.AAC.1
MTSWKHFVVIKLRIVEKYRSLMKISRDGIVQKERQQRASFKKNTALPASVQGWSRPHHDAQPLPAPVLATVVGNSSNNPSAPVAAAEDSSTKPACSMTTPQNIRQSSTVVPLLPNERFADIRIASDDELLLYWPCLVVKEPQRTVTVWNAVKEFYIQCQTCQAMIIAGCLKGHPILPPFHRATNHCLSFLQVAGNTCANMIQ